MRTSPVTPEALVSSVLSVPPLCRRSDLSLAREANAALLRHMRAGGVRTFLYGGNANLYNIGVRGFEALLDDLESLAEPDDWMIPSVGADFGKALDQIDILRARAFPSAMVLPLRFPATPAGVARGLGLLADRYGRPLIAYVKDEGYLEPADLAALARDGAVCAVKYAIVRKEPAEDPILSELVDRIGPERIISGIGERPVLAHMTRFGLGAFTSGSVCIAPRLSTRIGVALRAGRIEEAAALREKFLPLEDLRDAFSPLRVLHEAVRLCGIAETGPIYPFLSNIDDSGILARIEEAAKALRAENEAAAIAAAAE